MKTDIKILRDPTKLEWLVIDLGDGHILPIHCYKDFARNYDLADVIKDALIETTWYAPDNA